MRVTEEKSPRGGTVPVTVISSDDISILSDDELSNKFSAIKRRIDQGRKKSLEVKLIRGLEVELCYLHREISIRHDRRRSHDAFAEKHHSNRSRGGRGCSRSERR